MSDPFMTTFTGKRVSFSNPSPETIYIEDIAHALSQICRYTGHAQKFYSVAEHSMNVSSMLSTDLALYGLLHDAAEAYVNDLCAPLKNYLVSTGEKGYAAMESRFEAAIAEKFGLDQQKFHAEDVRTMDRRVLLAEAEVLITGGHEGWGLGDDPAPVLIFGYAPQIGELFFLKHFRRLIGEGVSDVERVC